MTGSDRGYSFWAALFGLATDLSQDRTVEREFPKGIGEIC